MRFQFDPLIRAGPHRAAGSAVSAAEYYRSTVRHSRVKSDLERLPAAHLPVASDNSLSYSGSDFNGLDLAFGASLSLPKPSD